MSANASVRADSSAVRHIDELIRLLIFDFSGVPMFANINDAYTTRTNAKGEMGFPFGDVLAGLLADANDHWVQLRHTEKATPAAWEAFATGHIEIRRISGRMTFPKLSRTIADSFHRALFRELRMAAIDYVSNTDDRLAEALMFEDLAATKEQWEEYIEIDPKKAEPFRQRVMKLHSQWDRIEARLDIELSQAMRFADQHTAPSLNGHTITPVRTFPRLACPKCGGTEIDRNGSSTKNGSRVRYYSCAKCGPWKVEPNKTTGDK
jgi:Predicted Zn-ribbon RNA-binding protein with a function in translation